MINALLLVLTITRNMYTVREQSRALARLVLVLLFSLLIANKSALLLMLIWFHWRINENNFPAEQGLCFLFVVSSLVASHHHSRWSLLLEPGPEFASISTEGYKAMIGEGTINQDVEEEQGSQGSFI